MVTNGSHGDYSLVKNNLCLKAPENLKKKDLSFSFLASISINAYKISKTKVNHKSAVVGLGIIGSILASYILSENRSVITFDTDKDKVDKFKSEYSAQYVHKDLRNIIQILKIILMSFTFVLKIFLLIYSINLVSY